MELYKKYRPKDFEEVIGNDDIVNSIKSYLEKDKLPHTILFTGASGTGKTTLARIIASKLGLTDYEIELSEYNMSDKECRGIDGINKITDGIEFSSLTGSFKVFIFDEADQITDDAQKMLKKILEDTPSHVYFMLCTTKPEKLVKDIRTRATEFMLNPVDKRILGRYLRDIATREGDVLETSISMKIAEKADGSVRKAMVILDQILEVEDNSEREKLLETIITDTKDATVNLAKLLLDGEPWTKISQAVKNIKDEPESIRYGILGYCNSVLLGTYSARYARAYQIITVMSDSYMYVGKAGLTRDCYSLC